VASLSFIHRSHLSPANGEKKRMTILPGARLKDALSIDQGKPGRFLDEEEKLLDGLRKGDSAAFYRAIKLYTPRLLSLSRRIVGPDHAEDVVQETWLSVCKSIREFEGRSSLSTWLHRIATNKSLNLLRLQSRFPVLEADFSESAPELDWYGKDGSWQSPFPDSAQPAPEDLLSAEDLEECLDKHIALLPHTQRVVLVLRDIENLPYDEICNRLELSESNVRVLLHRGRQRLMKMIRQYQEDGTC